MVEEKLDDIIKEKDYINNLYVHANSFSKRKDIIRDLSDLMSLEYLIRGYEFNSLPSEIINSKEYYKYEDECIKASALNFFENYSFYKEQSVIGIDKFYNSKFDQFFHERRRNKVKLKRNEGIELVEDFLNEQSPKAYKLFSNMLKDSRILFTDYISDEVEGKCYNISRLNKNYLIISGEKDTLQILSLMMHEFGHAYESQLLNNKNFEQRNGIYKTFLHETASFYFELSFYNYLKRNKIYPIENYFMREHFFHYLLQHFLEEYYITHANLEAGTDYFIDEDINEIEKYLKEKYYYNVYFNDDKTIDFNSTLVYLTSMLVSIELVHQNQDRNPDFLTYFDNTLMTYGITHDSLIFENLGVSKETLLDSKNLENSLKLHQEEGISLKLK